MSAAWAGGSTRAHRAWRAVVIARDPLCTLRIKCDGTAPSTHADHVVPKSVDPELALDPSNGRGACEACNTSRGAGEFARERPEIPWAW